MSKEIVVPDKKGIELNLDIIKKYICPKATEQEAYMFLQLCKSQGLNPFLREAYLIKYGDEAATFVTGKETFTKRADRITLYNGFKAGIIVVSNNQVVFREGSFIVEGEKLLGGWAEVYRKDRITPFRNEVSLKEYEGHKRDGTISKSWRERPATMIRKVALVQSLREAFPDEYAGMYSPEEMQIDETLMPVYAMGQQPIIPLPEEKKPIQPPQAKTTTEVSAAEYPGQQESPESEKSKNTISEPQRKRLFAISKKAGLPDEDIKAFLLTFGFTSSKEITKDKYDEICTRIEAGDLNITPECEQNPDLCGESEFDAGGNVFCADTNKPCEYYKQGDLV